jgi:uncharacterized protein (TIGR02444 family)
MAKKGQEAFWDFSVRTYRSSGVPEACLDLQDEQGADVNMLLYCCWAGGCGASLDAGSFDRAQTFSRDWSGQVVRPLRAARRWMKQDGCAAGPVDRDACMALRQQVKNIELAAEKLQQLALAALPLPAGGSPVAGDAQLAAVAANLRRYCTASGIRLDDVVIDRLRIIVRAGFPELRQESLQAFAADLATA